MSKIPCLKNKCLLLPVCKSKEILECDDLYRLGKTIKNNLLLYINLIILFPKANYITNTFNFDSIILNSYNYVNKLRRTSCNLNSHVSKKSV